MNALDIWNALYQRYDMVSQIRGKNFSGDQHDLVETGDIGVNFLFKFFVSVNLVCCRRFNFSSLRIVWVSRRS